MKNPIVKVNEGFLEGKINGTEAGVLYFSFYGIPYAKPPTGELRFKYPIRSDCWEGIRDATKEGGKAAQYDIMDNSFSGQDDCLFVNVHAPKLNGSLPVMVYIHGGGFVQGSGNEDEEGPDFLVAKNVIIVTFNYRLGVMGFLCADPENARGDTGLMDQNMALRWIKDNVENFGGDPDNITLFGESAGAASVEYHLLSPLSEGLFNKAIIQSGSVFCSWARNRDPITSTRRLAKQLGYDATKGDEGMFEFLKSFETQALVEASKPLHINDHEDLKNGRYFPFTPVVDFFKDGKGFLKEEPAQIYKNGNFHKVPTICGFCEDEGIFAYALNRGVNDDNMMEYIPNYYNKTFDPKLLKKHYPKRPYHRNSNGNVIDFLSDLAVVSGMLYGLDRRMEHEDNFLYNFCHQTDFAVFKVTNDDGRQIEGVSHAEDLPFLFAIEKIAAKPDDLDLAMRETMVGMWTNFAKTGRPSLENVDWLPISKKHFQYMELNAKRPQMKIGLNDHRRKLWKEICAYF